MFHFFHKAMKGVIRECSYNEESEEHIRRIGIILEYMKEAYKDIKYEFRYKLPNNKYADLYFKFEDGNELAIEFERQDLDFEYWEEKHNSFKSLNINDLWFIKMDNNENINKLYDLSLYRRVVLNNMFNEANVVFKDNCEKEYKIKKEIEKQKNLINIQNSYMNDQVFENKMNVEIKGQKSNNVEDERIIYGKTISEVESKAKVHEIIYIKLSENNRQEKTEEYRQILNKAVNSNYDKYYIQRLSREMNYETDTYDAIKRVLLELIENGNEKAENFYKILYK